MNKDFLKKLYDAIPEGKENAVSLRELSRLLEIGERETKAQVLKAREHGYVICSLPSEQVGYYKPANIDEAKRCYLMFAKRAETSNSVVSGIERYLIESGCNPEQLYIKKGEGETIV